MINDAHIHFFSPGVFDILGAQRGLPAVGRVSQVVNALGWDNPVSPDVLADRWIAELDRHGVRRAAMIASVPGDETSVAVAIARHPSRFVGFFMLDPTQPDAVQRVTRAFAAGLRGVCLYPAMHRYTVHDSRAAAIFERAAAHPGAVVFVHCGVLSVGVRKTLRLPSPFDMGCGNPLYVHAVALRFPALPIIVPHFGAGLFREALMLADVCSNVYLDTSSSNAWMRYTPGLTLEEVFRTAADVIGPSRLLFGTDSSFFPRGWVRDVYEAQVTAMTSAGLDEAARTQILAENFDKLFR